MNTSVNIQAKVNSDILPGELIESADFEEFGEIMYCDPDTGEMNVYIAHGDSYQAATVFDILNESNKDGVGENIRPRYQ